MIQTENKLTMSTRMKYIAVGIILGGVYYLYSIYSKKANSTTKKAPSTSAISG